MKKEEETMGTLRRLGWISVAAAVPLLAVLAASGSVSSVLSEKNLIGGGTTRVAPVGGPIPGTQVSFGRARKLVAQPQLTKRGPTPPQPLPVLPATTLQVPCEDSRATVQLLETWASDKSVPPEYRQVGTMYSNGIWMSIDMIGGWPGLVETAVMPRDPPGGISISEVRGVRSWVVDREAITDCGPPIRPEDDGGDTQTVTATPGPSMPSGTDSEAVIFDVTRTSSIRWVERGMVIQIVGPYPAATLRSLAEGITWE